jgi:alkanesulfonate monooxygenase SsuD/methylene tetrahydromethanopterin reductase-like flavin-dependent oxidoreductase (luciferase family)
MRFSNLFNHIEGAGKWIPRRAAQELGVGSTGALMVGSPKTVTDQMDVWVEEADLDEFNLSLVVQPGS